MDKTPEEYRADLIEEAEADARYVAESLTAIAYTAKGYVEKAYTIDTDLLQDSEPRLLQAVYLADELSGIMAELGVETELSKHNAKLAAKCREAATRRVESEARDV